MRFAVPLFVTLTLAQTPPPDAQRSPAPLVFATGVDIVSLDVTVVDKDGNPARDLTAEDFEVKVGGKQRQVLSAEFYEHTGRLAADAPPPPSHYSTNEGLSPGRLVLIAVDEGNITAGAGRFAARSAGQLVDRLGPADRVGFVAIPG